jgi:WD40 repeat protein
MFDPYHKWLGIPKDQRPPTHYQLLGIAPGETDSEVIEEAAIRQSSHLRAYQLGPHAEVCTRLLNEIARARATLLDPAKRRHYEQTIVRKPVTAITAITATVPAPVATPFDDLDDTDDRPLARPRSAPVHKPAASNAGLWIGLAVAGVLGIVGSIVVVTMLIHSRDVVHRMPAPPVPPLVPIKDDEAPAPGVNNPREQVLADAAAHWRLGVEQAAQKHPKYPLITAGDIKQNVAADGPGARPDAKVASMEAAHFNAGREPSPAGTQLTVYLRLRDPQARWDYGLFSKRGNANQSAFHLTCGPTPTGRLMVFDVDTSNGRNQASFPMNGIDLRAWHDIVGRYDGQKVQIICDGRIVAQRPAGGAIGENNQDLLIGAEVVNGQLRRPFTGAMEDAALWTRSLSDEEVAKLSGTDRLVVAIAPAPPPPPPVNVAAFTEIKPGEEYRLGKLVMALALTPNGRYALFQQPRGIAVWSVEESREVRTVPMVNIPVLRIAASPDNRTFAAVTPNGRVLVCDLEAGTMLRELVHGPMIHAVAFSSDGALLATGGGSTKTTTFTKIWDVKKGDVVQTLSGETIPTGSLALHDGTALTVDMLRTLRRWDVKNGTLLDTQRVDARTPLFRFASDLTWAAFVRANNHLIIQDLAAKRDLRQAPLPPGADASGPFDVTPDGRMGLVATRDKTLVFCDLVQGVATKVLTGHQQTIRAVGLTPDGKRALSFDSNLMLHIWKLDDVAGQVAAAPLSPLPMTKPEVKTETKPETKVETKVDPKFIPEWEAIKCPSFCSIAITPDSGKAVTAGPGVDVWDLATGKHLHNLLTPRGNVSGSVALSPDGRQVVGVAGDNVLRIWEVSTGKLLQQYDFPNDRRLTCADWSASGQYVACAHRHLVDIFTADSLRPWRTHDLGGSGNVESLVFFARDQLVVCGMENGAIRTGQVSDNKQTTPFEHSKVSKVNQIAAFKDRIFSVGLDNKFSIWDASPKPRLVDRVDATTNARALAISPSGVYAVTGGDDKKIRFWNLTNRRILQSYDADGAIRALAYAPNGRYFLSAGDDGQLRAWKLPKEIAK